MSKRAERAEAEVTRLLKVLQDISEMGTAFHMSKAARSAVANSEYSK